MAMMFGGYIYMDHDDGDDDGDYYDNEHRHYDHGDDIQDCTPPPPPPPYNNAYDSIRSNDQRLLIIGSRQMEHEHLKWQRGIFCCSDDAAAAVVAASSSFHHSHSRESYYSFPPRPSGSTTSHQLEAPWEARRKNNWYSHKGTCCS